MCVTSFSPTLRSKSTLLKTVRCFFVGRFSKEEVQFEGMCLSVLGTRHGAASLAMGVAKLFGAEDNEGDKNQ